MARYSVSATVSGTMNGNPRVTRTGSLPDVMNGATLATTKAAVTADVATLVADAASPTQAHVTTLNADYTLLLADIAGAGSATADVILSFNATNVTTRNQLRAAVAAILAQLDGSSVLT